MNEYINKACADGCRVRVWTTNGAQMAGVITMEKDKYILLEVNGVEHMVYKHAISTIRAEA